MKALYQRAKIVQSLQQAIIHFGIIVFLFKSLYLTCWQQQKGREQIKPTCFLLIQKTRKQ